MFYDSAMRDDLTTETPNPRSRGLDLQSSDRLVDLMLAEDAGLVDAVRAVAPAIVAAIDLVEQRLRADGRLIYVGAGTSGRLGVLDASELPPTFSADPDRVVGVIAGGRHALDRSIEGAEDDPAAARDDLLALEPSRVDVVFGIAASGRTPYVVEALRVARECDAATVALSFNADSAIGPDADVDIRPIVGPEIVAGSTRMKAGTATKMILNIVTTSVMIRLGKVYDNRMVDVRATNDKLRVRATRIVAALCSITEGAARAALERCDWEVKTAIASVVTGATVDDARAALDAADGRLRAIVGDLPRD